MAYIDWRIRGPEVVTCNCAYGCPCQFNSLPTYGDCRAAIAMRIDEGHFGDVSLDGVKWANLLAWPGAIHEGGGQAQPIVDPSANERQIDALFKILKGEETEPGKTIFNVFASVIDTTHEPLFQPITFDADVAKGTFSVRVDGVCDFSGEPIRNPVTGAPHRARVTLPEGFEYRVAEYASGKAKATGKVEHEWSGRHAHLVAMHMTQHGVVD